MLGKRDVVPYGFNPFDAGLLSTDDHWYQLESTQPKNQIAILGVMRKIQTVWWPSRREKSGHLDFKHMFGFSTSIDTPV